VFLELSSVLSNLDVPECHICSVEVIKVNYLRALLRRICLLGVAYLVLFSP
jgi:hypothetical protein